MSVVGFTIDPFVLLLVLGATALYLRAVRVLARRGFRVPAWQQAAWHGGVLLTAAGLLSPIDGLAEDLLSAHMAQHLLIADLAAPLLLVGVRTPVLQNYLPPRVLAPLSRHRPLRRLLRRLRNPLVAIGVYVLVLYAWHFPFAFEAALRNPWVHAFQHESFVIAAVMVWWPALEPDRAKMRGELWKIGHIMGARLAGMFLGMAFVIMSAPAYAGFYGDAAREHGMSPLFDQQLAGGMMLLIDVLTMLFALAFFFWRAGVQHDHDAELEERRRTAAAA